MRRRRSCVRPAAFRAYRSNRLPPVIRIARKHSRDGMLYRDSIRPTMPCWRIRTSTRSTSPLPNSLHLPWTLRALSAGKHVLCEKPLTCNADEAVQVAEAAERSGRVAAEAMAYRHHPLAARLVELTAQLGRLRHIEVFNCVPIFRRSDIRYQYDLGGGAAMDLGGYAVSLVRLLTGAEPEPTSVEVRLARPRVDRWIAADLRLPNGATAKVTCSLWSTDFLRSDAKIKGEAGWMKVVNPFAPHLFHYVTSQIGGGGRIRERLRSGESTYACQLRAFVKAVREGGPVLTPATDAAQTLRVIDQMYRLAGLPLRHSMATGAP